ncbi:MAG TPA: hypothetical protein ENN05_02060 [Deltaproteobacteria bacterium]|nr:hypothetical protein [Deltaproteobacteria bacterium]
MKRWLLFAIGVVFVMTPAVIQAKERVLLGDANFAVKLDYISFSHDFFEEINDDATVYAGIEAYGKVTDNIYLGGEIGTASVSSADLFSGIIHALLSVQKDEVSADITFMELNVKYAKDISRFFVVDVGTGISYNRALVEFETRDWVDIGGTNYGVTVNSREESEWLFGGQVFADRTFK